MPGPVVTDLALFTLFQVMTGEAWSDVAREVMADHPWAWIFFVAFILLCTFVVLNLFIAVVVRAMEDDDAEETEQIVRTVREAEHESTALLLAEITALRAEVQAMRDARGTLPHGDHAPLGRDATLRP